MTAPVPPAHLSFIDGIFFLRPVFSSSLKTMIFASCPPSSITEFTSGCSFSTASETAVTSCTNFAPTRLARRAAARAGDEDAAVMGSNADFVLHALEELQQLLRLLGLVALVILPDHLVVFGIRPRRPSPSSSRRPCRRCRPPCGRIARRPRATSREFVRAAIRPPARVAAVRRAEHRPSLGPCSQDPCW